MTKQIQALDMSTFKNAPNTPTGKVTQETIDIATSCPHCGISLMPNILYAALIEDEVYDSDNTIFVFNHCPKCNKCFISRHIYDSSTDIYMFDSSSQINFFRVDFSKNIQDLSPNFTSIFTDTAHAESLGLTSICGMGYRKALEFLVKDYSISIAPGDKENISKMPLAQCIDKYIANPKLKTLAKASAWLGNDETHYVRKHTAHGLPELKAYITALVNYVDTELSCLDASKLISS